MTLMISGVDGHMDLRDLKRVKDENFGIERWTLVSVGNRLRIWD